MSRILITGGTGFLGHYLAGELLGHQHEVTATFLDPPPFRLSAVEGVNYVPLDVTDPGAVGHIISQLAPDIVYHLAGQAYVQESLARPEKTMWVNFQGTLAVLEGVRRAETKTSVVFIGSGTEYGQPDEVPTPESSELRPSTPYALSKAAADLACYQYFRTHGLRTLRIRLFGTTGPGKVGDAANDFASQIAAAEAAGGEGEVRVGALDMRRDILDVRDAVRAFSAVADRGVAGVAYNVGSGQSVVIRDLLDRLLRLSTARPAVVVEPGRHRVGDEPVHLAHVGKLSALGWSPAVPLDQTLRDVMEYWRRAPGEKQAAVWAKVPLGPAALL